MNDFTLDFTSDPLSTLDDLDPFPSDQEEEHSAIPVVLLSLDQGKFDAQRSLDELAALAEANGMEAVATVCQKRSTPEAATMLGEGKVAEARLVCMNTRAEAAIFDGELSGSQIRNLSAALQVEVLDRTMLILEIFKSRASTNEGKLQTELAMLRYQLPRLQGLGEALSRQGGGGGGGGGARRGAGETKLELDRRHLHHRIEHLEGRLKELEKRRGETRRARQKNNVPVVALVGYTNVGKSTLLNALTGAEVLVENKLFATLDPTARKLPLPDGTTALLVDTVGFVSRLPHHLVQAFRSTLKESAYADLILQVCDLQADNLELQLATTRETLESLEIGETPILTVFNKCDNTKCIESLPAGISREGAVFVSARTGYNLDGLLQKIAELLLADYLPVDCLLPFSQAVLENTLREKGQLRQSEYLADGIRLVGSCPQEIFYLFAPYQREGAGE